MAAQVNDLVRDIKTDNKDEVTKEIDRVQAIFKTKKSNLTKTMNKITDLRSAISEGTSDVVSDPHEGNINIVAKHITRLDKCKGEFDLVHERLDTLHNFLKDLDEATATKGIKTLDEDFEEYDSNYDCASVNIVKIKSDQDVAKPKENTQPSQSGTTERRWTPSDVFKPSTLRLTVN